MKKLFASFVLALAVSAFAGSAIAQELIIANGCDFPLHFIGLSRGSESQATNLITAPLAPGDGIKVNLNENKAIDLTVQDNEGTQLEFSGLDLSSASKVTLKADGTAIIE